MLNLLPIVSIFSLGRFLCRFFLMLILCYVNHWCDFKFKCIHDCLTGLFTWCSVTMKMNPFFMDVCVQIWANHKQMSLILSNLRTDRSIMQTTVYCVIQDAVWATFFRENNQECSWSDVCYSVISSHTLTHTDAIRLLSFSISPNQIIGCCCTPDDWIWYSGFSYLFSFCFHH